jgi:hypothetical protein
MNAEKGGGFPTLERHFGGNKALLRRIRKMARANRHYLPGCVWHITHRCHKKEFLPRKRDVSYNGIFAGENSGLRADNTYSLNIPA